MICTFSKHVVLLLCVLAIVVPAPLFAQADAAHQYTLEEIAAGMAAAVAQIHDLHAVYTTFYDIRNPNGEPHSTAFYKVDDTLRVADGWTRLNWQTTIKDLAGKITEQKDQSVVFNGRSTIQIERRPDGTQQAYVRPGRDERSFPVSPSRLFDIIYTSFDSLRADTIRSEKNGFHITDQNVPINGARCVRITGTVFTKLDVTLLVCPEHSFLPEQMEHQHRESKSSAGAMVMTDIRRLPNNVFFPFKITSYRSPTDRTNPGGVYEIKEVSLDKLPDDAFAPNYAPGTEVTDQVEKKAYRVLDTPNHPSPSMDGFGAKVQQALGIKDTGVAILPLLDDAILALDDPPLPGKIRPALDKLVDALLAGPHPGALAQQFFAPVVQISRPAGRNATPPEPPIYYEPGERIRLIKALWALAQSTQPSNPDRAAQIGRATFMLAAINDLGVGWAQLSEVTRNPTATKKLLALPDEPFEQLRKLVADRITRTLLGTAEMTAASNTIDTLRKSEDKPAPLPDVKVALAHLDKAFREGPAQRATRDQVGWLAGDLLGLLKDRNNADGETLVRLQLDAWKRDLPDPDTDNLIRMILAVGIPPNAPFNLLGRFTLAPDGQVVPRNSSNQNK